MVNVEFTFTELESIQYLINDAIDDVEVHIDTYQETCEDWPDEAYERLLHKERWALIKLREAYEQELE